MEKFKGQKLELFDTLSYRSKNKFITNINVDQCRCDFLAIKRFLRAFEFIEKQKKKKKKLEKYRKIRGK